MHKKKILGRLEYKVVAGIGLLSMTREKAEANINLLIERGEIAPEEAKDVVDKLVQRGAEEQQAIRDMARSEIAEVLKASNIATKTELDTLSNKLDILLEQFNKL